MGEPNFCDNIDLEVVRLRCTREKLKRQLIEVEADIGIFEAARAAREVAPKKEMPPYPDPARAGQVAATVATPESLAGVQLADENRALREANRDLKEAAAVDREVIERRNAKLVIDLAEVSGSLYRSEKKITSLIEIDEMRGSALASLRQGCELKDAEIAESKASLGGILDVWQTDVGVMRQSVKQSQTAIHAARETLL